MKYRIIIKLIYPSGAERTLKTKDLLENEAKAIEVQEKLTALVEESFNEGLDGHTTAPTIGPNNRWICRIYQPSKTCWVCCDNY